MSFYVVGYFTEFTYAPILLRIYLANDLRGERRKLLFRDLNIIFKIFLGFSVRDSHQGSTKCCALRPWFFYRPQFSRDIDAWRENVPDARIERRKVSASLPSPNDNIFPLFPRSFSGCFI